MALRPCQDVIEDMLISSSSRPKFRAIMGVVCQSYWYPSDECATDSGLIVNYLSDILKYAAVLIPRSRLFLVRQIVCVSFDDVYVRGMLFLHKASTKARCAREDRQVIDRCAHETLPLPRYLYAYGPQYEYCITLPQGDLKRRRVRPFGVKSERSPPFLPNLNRLQLYQERYAGRLVFRADCRACRAYTLPRPDRASSMSIHVMSFHVPPGYSISWFSLRPNFSPSSRLSRPAGAYRLFLLPPLLVATQVRMESLCRRRRARSSMVRRGPCPRIPPRLKTVRHFNAIQLVSVLWCCFRLTLVGYVGWVRWLGESSSIAYRSNCLSREAYTSLGIRQYKSLSIWKYVRTKRVFLGKAVESCLVMFAASIRSCAFSIHFP